MISRRVAAQVAQYHCVQGTTTPSDQCSGRLCSMVLVERNSTEGTTGVRGQPSFCGERLLLQVTKSGCQLTLFADPPSGVVPLMPRCSANNKASCSLIPLWMDSARDCWSPRGSKLKPSARSEPESVLLQLNSLRRSALRLLSARIWVRFLALWASTWHPGTAGNDHLGIGYFGKFYCL